MHNFYPITRLEWALSIGTARDNGLVDLHSDTPPMQSQVSNELCGGVARRDNVCLTIHNNVHSGIAYRA